MGPPTPPVKNIKYPIFGVYHLQHNCSWTKELELWLNTRLESTTCDTI